jgi:hypothetical protein
MRDSHTPENRIRAGVIRELDTAEMKIPDLPKAAPDVAQKSSL